MGWLASSAVLRFLFQATSLKVKPTTRNPESVRFLRHARGSLAEIETQLLIAQDRGYISKVGIDELILQTDELGRVIRGLVNSMTKGEGKS